MTLKKTLERVASSESERRTLSKLFAELGEALADWNNTTDKNREEDTKNKYRKVSNSILSITNNSQYRLVICDILSCNREIVAHPQKEAKRGFRFVF